VLIRKWEIDWSRKIILTIKETVLTRRYYAALVIAALALIIIVKEPRVTAQQPTSVEQPKIVEVMSTFIAAIHDEDLAKFDTTVVPGFYIFDNGVRFNGDALMTIVKNMHAAGKHFEWHVTEPDVHMSGNTAWIAYVNKGSITSGSTTTDQQWLESAFLTKQSGDWKIVFMHSTRVPPPTIVQGK
jgi:ketosteroid isomerase-like protein